MDIQFGDFVWDEEKEHENIQKHGVDFLAAARAFQDPRRVIVVDSLHSREEARSFCLGKAEGTILTVRFVYRDGKIRIFGAGAWRKGAKYYEQENREI